MRPLQKALIQAAALAVLAAPATAFDVGPGGTHATIQSAIDAAVMAGGEQTIRVVAGTWPERLTINYRGRTGRLTLTGGCAPAFTECGTGPLSTVGGKGTGPVVFVDTGTGAGVTIVGFEITRGNAGREEDGVHHGAGLWAVVDEGGRLNLDGLLFRENELAADMARGGGLAVRVSGNLTLVNNTFESNSVSGTALADGGGAWIRAEGNAVVTVMNNAFDQNEASCPSGAGAAGLSVSAGPPAAFVRVERNTFTDHRTASDAGPDQGTLSLLVARRDLGGIGGRILALGNTVTGHQSSSGNSPQVSLRNLGESLLRFADGIVAEGNGDGIAARADKPDVLYISNATIVGHPGAGVASGESPFPVYVSNTILWENGAAFDVEPVTTVNLVDVDPHFDPDKPYHLTEASPALNAGTNAPPDPLSEQDVDGEMRWWGSAVDVGADELQPPPGSDPPVCDVAPLADRYSGACRCLSDSSLREFRCMGFRDDLVFSARIPFPIGPVPSIEPAWTFVPWGQVAGPYRIDARALIGGTWVLQERLTQPKGGLVTGQPTIERFRWKLPKGPVRVRTTLDYWRPNQSKPATAAVEIQLPKP